MHLKGRRWLAQVRQQACAAQLHGSAIAGEAQIRKRQFLTVRIQQANEDRDVEGGLLRLPGGRRATLLDLEAEGAVLPVGAHRQDRGAGLGIPAPELVQVDAIGVLHRRHEVLGGHGLAVVAVEVQIRALAEAFAAHQARGHAHHFGALFIDGGGVEVGYLDVGVRAHGMGHGAAVLGELHGPQQRYVLDALHGPRVHVGSELRIPEHREALLEAQLEPIPAGDPVAGPVVEVLVGDNRLHPFVGGVSGGVRGGQHAGGVEDVQALVLHGPGIEVLHRHDHEDVQVVLAPEGFLIPAHGALQCSQGILALANVVRLRVDAQLHLPPARGGEVVGLAGQVTGHQGEEVGRLRERVLPSDRAPLPALVVRHQIAVGQQHWKALGVGGDAGGELRQHVGPVLVVGDLAKALGFALGAIHRLRLVQAQQGTVVLRLDAGLDLQLERRWRSVNGEGLIIHPVFVAA